MTIVNWTYHEYMNAIQALISFIDCIPVDLVNLRQIYRATLDRLIEAQNTMIIPKEFEKYFELVKEELK